jgi:hypothetical protein
MTTQEKLFNRALSDGGALIRNGLEDGVIQSGFKFVYRPDRKRKYRVYNTNELPDDYAEITQEWLLRLLLNATSWRGLSHRLRELNACENVEEYIINCAKLNLDMCASVDGYVEKLKSILNENLPKPADVAIQPEQA